MELIYKAYNDNLLKAMAKVHHQNCASNDDSLQKNKSLSSTHANNNTNMLFTNANHAL